MITIHRPHTIVCDYCGDSARYREGLMPYSFLYETTDRSFEQRRETYSIVCPQCFCFDQGRKPFSPVCNRWGDWDNLSASARTKQK